MIKNIFYALTIALCAATIYFGYTTKAALTERIGQSAVVIGENENITKRLNGEMDEIKIIEVEAKTALDARNESAASLENEKGKENVLRRTAAQLDGEIEGFDAELVRIDEALNSGRQLIAQMVPNSGGSLNIDDVVAQIETLQNERKQKEVDLEDMTKTAKGLLTAVSSGKSQKARNQDRLIEVRRRISLNSVTARVSAAENGYGFVILNRGSKNSNISEQSKLLVSRGGSFVGRLTVDAIESNQTIANIVQDSLKPGQRIQAGDTVIMETPVSN